MAWRPRRSPVLLALVRLAALTALVEGQRLPEPPSLPDYALPDAMAIIGGDAVAALSTTPDDQLLADATAVLSAALLATR
jgi:hypothetical protein